MKEKKSLSRQLLLQEYFTRWRSKYTGFWHAKKVKRLNNLCKKWLHLLAFGLHKHNMESQAKWLGMYCPDSKFASKEYSVTWNCSRIGIKRRDDSSYRTNEMRSANRKCYCMNILLLEIVLPQNRDETWGWSIFILLFPEFPIALDVPWNFWRYWCIQVCMFSTIRHTDFGNEIFFY